MTDFLLTFFRLLFQILYIAIFVRIIMSWIDQGGQMRITQILHEITEPILAPIRRIMPSMGMFDLSPMVAIILLQVLQRLLLSAIP
ncbi:MAG TPA: YggT family protein [Herpetosiphonaceae bacterium]|nr:YggT family protein [Herpetosiphonaceae bacterium]